jgi:hypothetical protein
MVSTVLADSYQPLFQVLALLLILVLLPFAIVGC